MGRRRGFTLLVAISVMMLALGSGAAYAVTNNAQTVTNDAPFGFNHSGNRTHCFEENVNPKQVDFRVNLWGTWRTQLNLSVQTGIAGATFQADPVPPMTTPPGGLERTIRIFIPANVDLGGPDAYRTEFYPSFSAAADGFAAFYYNDGDGYIHNVIAFRGTGGCTNT
jgi:hypothetical protein